jgi:hypothetical protein
VQNGLEESEESALTPFIADDIRVVGHEVETHLSFSLVVLDEYFSDELSLAYIDFVELGEQMDVFKQQVLVFHVPLAEQSQDVVTLFEEVVKSLFLLFDHVLDSIRFDDSSFPTGRLL